MTSMDLVRAVCRQSWPGWHVLVVMLLASVWGCALNYETTKSARSPLEQMLMTQALQRSLVDVVAPVRARQSVAVEAVGLTGDQAFFVSQIEKWLVREGFDVPKDKDGKENLVARVTIEAFGTIQDGTFFGIPPVSGGLLPLALPELAFYKATRQRGVSRFSIDFVDKKSGHIIRSTAVHEGDAYYNMYVFLFAFSINSTDMTPPPPR